MDRTIIMSAEEVYTLLGIKESTLRKYAGILKKAGYHFQVNRHGQRGYYNADVIALKKLMDIKENPDMTLEQAADAVVSWFQQANAAVVDTPAMQHPDHSADRYADDMARILNTMEHQRAQLDQQNQIIARLIDRLDSRERRAEERDRKLMDAIRTSQETKQILLELRAAQEQTAADQAKSTGERFRDWFQGLLPKKDQD